MQKKKIVAFSLGVLCWLMLPITGLADKVERENGSVVAVAQSSSVDWGLSGVVWFGIAALYDIAGKNDDDIVAL